MSTPLCYRPPTWYWAHLRVPSRFSRFGATGCSCWLSVVRTRCVRRLALSPCSRISRATRLRPRCWLIALAAPHACAGCHTPGGSPDTTAQSAPLPLSAPGCGGWAPAAARHTHRHLQDPTHRLDRILLLVHGNELILHLDSCEKMLTTFFKMSRSCRVISSSRHAPTQLLPPLRSDAHCLETLALPDRPAAYSSDTGRCH